MPTIQPSDIWIKSGRFNDYGKEMLKIIDRNKNELLYGPTNEEMITDIIKNDLKSYKDLPKLLFHVQWKFRDEIRPRFGVMRCREFLMKDAYSFDISYEESYSSYCKMFALYIEIFKSLGLTIIPVKAESGPIGGALSHEFILETENGETEIFYDRKLQNSTKNIINFEDKEAIITSVEEMMSFYSCSSEKHDNDKFVKDVNIDDRVISKGIEVGHIFYFGTKYSEAFDAYFLNNSGKKELIHSGSYGIGVSRLVAAIIEANHDENGIVWPKEVAPFNLGLINVRNDNEISTNFCENVYQRLQVKYDILYDDRDIRVGEKFNNMDLLGIPLQLIAGEKNLSNSNLEIKHRLNGKTELIGVDNLNSYLESYYEL